MNQNMQHANATNVQTQTAQARRTQLRKDAEEMLRDMAFVLKMTQRVREEMKSEQKSEDLMLV
jgi:hypothetical protein